MLDTKLYTLLKVAEYRNFTQAAKSLNLTQPAVSQHIHALEADLGVKLFIRSGTRLNLTKEGEKAVTAARMIKNLYNNLKYDISEGAAKVKELSIGITHTVESNRISEILAKYATENNGMMIRLETGTQGGIIQKLKSYDLDLGIIDGAVNDADLETTRLDEDSLVLVMDPSHALAEKNSVTLDDIRSEKLILRLPESGTGNLFISSVQSMGMDMSFFNVILEIDNIATIKDLVRHGYGVSVLAKSACMDEIAKKKLIALPIRQLKMNREINIVCARDFSYRNFISDIIQMYNS